MPLPSIIEIVPVHFSGARSISVPGSKSITNRALILAALCRGKTTLRGALWSEDTQVMVDCLRELGFKVDVIDDPEEVCNRLITVEGLGGHIPKAGTRDQPLELFVGNAGTAARFLSAFVTLGLGSYRLSGVARMHDRPQSSLFDALKELGYEVESATSRLPAVIHGSGPRPGTCTVSIDQSSQFASALLLAGSKAGWTVNIIGENSDESPYVQMTLQLIETFKATSSTFQIEPDASSGSYFWGINGLGLNLKTSVQNWPATRWQIDEAFPLYLPLPRTISRQTDLGDSIMTAIVLAPFAAHAVTFSDLGRLRVQECERVEALRTELTRCGGQVQEDENMLRVAPGPLHGAEIETYNDHRMAMCFAMIGMKVPGMRIRNPSCVKKTFPNFFQKLADPAPGGLGIAVIDPSTGKSLQGEDLFAG